LGIKLKKFLFEPFSEDVVLKIQEVIFDTISYWLPFVRILNINVKMSDSERSTMQISVDFVLEKDPNNTESIQITIGE